MTSAMAERYAVTRTIAATPAEITEAIGKMINTSLSCVPPLVQLGFFAFLGRTESFSARV